MTVSFVIFLVQVSDEAAKRVTAEFYEQRSLDKYPTSDNPEMLALVARVTDWTGLRADERVLDFGSYDGYLLSRLSRHQPILGVGVDIAESAARLATRQSGGEGLYFLISDGAGLPFRSSSFDVVVCSEILEHVDDLDAVMAELSRCLRPGGRFYATMPNSLAEVWRPLRGICRLVDEVEGHVRRLSKDEFLDSGRRHSLTPTRCQYRGFAFSAVWYRLFIYNPRTKRRAMALVTSEQSVVQLVAKRAAFGAMHCYLAADRLFRRSSLCTGIDALFVKNGNDSARVAYGAEGSVVAPGEVPET